MKDHRPRTTALAAVACALAAAAATAPAAQAAWPGLSGRIVTGQELPPAASEPQDGKVDQELVAFGPDGSARQLTFTRTVDKQPSFSPDGKEIAFSSTRFGNREQVFLTPWGGDPDSGRRLFTDAAGLFSSQPAWSPDASRILYRSNRDTRTRKAELYTVGRAGTGHVRLTTTPDADERYPTFSPDGRRILFTSDRGGTMGIWVAESDGDDAQLLYDGPATDSAPAWSPDGSQVAFETFTVPETDGDLFVMDSDPATADAPRALAHSPAHDEGPAWSPDGSHLAFTSTRDGEHDTWLVPADGSVDPVNFTASDRYEESPEWQPIPSAGPAGQACGSAFGPLVARTACDTATRVMGRWHEAAAAGTSDDKVEGFACASTPHSYDQSIVDCRHEGGRKAVVFVGRSGSAG